MRCPALVTLLLLTACAGGANGPRRENQGSGDTNLGSNTHGTAEIRYAFRGEAQLVDAGGYSIPVYPEAEVVAEDETHLLTLTGYGVRKKQVFIVTADVYFAAHFLTRSTSSLPGTELQAIEESPAEIFELTLLRDLTGEQINSSLREAMQLNGIDSESADLAPVFEQLSRGAKGGDVIVLVAYTSPSREDSIVAILPEEVRVVKGRELGIRFWTVWFGVPLDGYMAELKSQLTVNF